MTIENFTTTFRNPARPNRFKIEIALPSFANTSGASQQISTFVKVASLPKSELGVVEVMHQGRTFPFPGDREFGDYSVQFYLEEDMKLRNVFESWNNSMNRFRANVSGAGPADYKRDFNVQQLSYGSLSVLKKYKFIKAFPVSVSEVALDMEDKNGKSSFEVIFRYDRFETNSTS